MSSVTCHPSSIIRHPFHPTIGNANASRLREKVGFARLSITLWTSPSCSLLFDLWHFAGMTGKIHDNNEFKRKIIVTKILRSSSNMNHRQMKLLKRRGYKIFILFICFILYLGSAASLMQGSSPPKKHPWSFPSQMILYANEKMYYRKNHWFHAIVSRLVANVQRG